MNTPLKTLSIALLCLASATLCAQTAAPVTPAGQSAPANHATGQATEEARQLSKEIIDTTLGESMVQSMRSMLGGMHTQIQAEMVKRMGSVAFNAKQQQIFARFNSEILEYLLGPAYFGKLREATANSYADVFTLEELRGIRDFYRSPAGVAFLAKAPQASERVLPVQQTLMAPFMKEVQARSVRMASEIMDAK
jgi:uncharacterized protein